MFTLSTRRAQLWLVCAALALSWAVGILGRGYWTPDEPREADIAWRMSWQTTKSVPLLAGAAFCEKPPLTYWVSAPAMKAFGPAAWAARLPNLFYAVITALSVGFMTRLGAGPLAGVAAGAAIGTFLLSYQVAIWLATDAPLLAATAVSLLGTYVGFYARNRGERLRGYSCMHAALACGFLSKSVAGWMVPALTLLTLSFWERRWREWLRWELYVGLCFQAAAILTWVWFVYSAADGTALLRIFFWNNLVGRFAHVDAPDVLQYAAAHRNSPGKYLLELPLYLWPWTLLVAAALRRAWLERRAAFDELRIVRFGLAAFLPTLIVLSFAATARNIYLAPALPGAAFLLGWWARESAAQPASFDKLALRGTALLLCLAAFAVAAVATLIGIDSAQAPPAYASYITICGAGVLGAALLAVHGERAARDGRIVRAAFALLIAYCFLLVGPASQIYRQVDTWQDLASIGRKIRIDAAGRPLVLFSPDETTRAFIDMHTRTAVELIGGPIDADSLDSLQDRLTRIPRSLVLTQLPSAKAGDALRRFAAHMGSRADASPPSQPLPLPSWATLLRLDILHEYALPNGRRYALLETGRALTPR